ncbi:uncharacterized protein DS421_5g162270 [Arachis hypogaea]|nr:uncharacterized protein DS421_5g162270 [Arachis hypogaea]
MAMRHSIPQRRWVYGSLPYCLLELSPSCLVLLNGIFVLEISDGFCREFDAEENM